MTYRLWVLIYWVLGRRNNVSFAELMRVLLDRPNVIKAKSKIRAIHETGSFELVEYPGLEETLYFPKEMPLNSLYQVTAELLYPNHWHFYEIEQTRVEETDIVADCGAGEGLFSLTVASRCQRVYIIEPLPRFVDALRLTFRERQNVEIMPVALSDTEGTAFISSEDIASEITKQTEGIPIALNRLDNLFFEKEIPLTYIKADLEGHELQMLQGARKTIERYTPKIAITTYHEAGHAKWIVDFLTKVNARYRFKVKGIEERAGAPVMLHAWITE